MSAGTSAASVSFGAEVVYRASVDSSTGTPSGTNGAISLDFAKLGPEGIRVETTNGMIGITLPRETKASLYAKARQRGVPGRSQMSKAELQKLCLVWGDDEALRVVVTVRQVTTHPAGLGPPGFVQFCYCCALLTGSCRTAEDPWGRRELRSRQRCRFRNP